jgi:transposase-like protein
MANRRIGRAERERRKGLVARWRRSGQSAAEFAKRHGLGPWVLYSWAKELGSGPQGEQREHGRRRKLRRVRRSAQRATAGRALDFLPVRLLRDGDAAAPVPAEGVVEIQLRGGDLVRVVGEVAAERVRAVLTAVRQGC